MYTNVILVTLMIHKDIIHRPGFLIRRGNDTLLQQLYELVRKCRKIYQQALVHFQALEVVLIHFQRI